MKIKVIKSYQTLTASLKSESELSFDSDRAVTDYLAFAQVGELHAKRVDDPRALEVMLEVNERIFNCLQERQKVLSLT